MGINAGADPRLLPLVLSLGLDTFAVSTAVGLAPLARRVRLRLVVLFALAEGLMPACGLLLGAALGSVLGAVADYVAAALLIATGIYMLREAGEEDDDDEVSRLAASASRVGWSLVALALSVSLDELAVGISFGVLRLSLGVTLVAIALQAALVSALGLWLGARLGRRVGRRAEVVAGVVLVVLGCAVALARLTGRSL